MFGDFDGFHAGAEAHGGVGLGDAAGHAAGDAPNEVAGAERFGVVFGFGGDEEEDGAFGGGFDPGPGDKALVVWLGRGLLAGSVLGFVVELGDGGILLVVTEEWTVRS